MARQKIYMGSIGPLLYDDTDPIDDQDGDFAGESRHAITTSGQMIVETAPTQANEIARKEEVDAVLALGIAHSLRVITNVRDNAGSIEVKYKDVTIASGIVTAVSAESGWTGTPL